MSSDADGRPPAWESPRTVIRWGAHAWALVGLALAFLLVWRGLGYLRIVVVPLSLALFPAAILTPVAAWLEERRWPPALASLAVLTVFVAVVATLVTLITLQIQSELSGLVDQLRSSYQQLSDRLAAVPLLPEPSALLGPGGGGDGGGSAQAALSAVTSTVQALTELFIFLVASFFFIKDRDQIVGWVTRQFPGSARSDAAVVGARMWSTVSSYIRGQTVIAAFDGAAVAVGLWLLGIPLAFVLGALVFFGAFVPVVGSIAAGAVAVLVALVTQGALDALFTLAIVVAVQQFEGNVLAPYVLGREVELHPLVILCAITAGALLLGVWGAVIAVPLTASAHRAGSFIRRERPTT